MRKQHAGKRQDGDRAPDLAIVGGGAAGMFAAVAATRLGLSCVVLERKARLGSKVLMTANGRCNFTNDSPPRRFLDGFAMRNAGSFRFRDLERQIAFLGNAVESVPPARIVSVLKSLGVAVKRMPDGRFFPADSRAATVVHAFGDFMRGHSVPIAVNCSVRGIERRGGRLAVDAGAFELVAKNVLVATGGASYPKLGSTGDGLEFARRLGHRVVPPRAGLIGLETDDRRVLKRAGRRCAACRVKVEFLSGGGFETSGEIDFERFGLGGAAIYNAQRAIRHEGDRPWRMKVEADGETFVFENLRSRPLKEAIVTIGGVATDEIDPATMESKIAPGVYFAGETIDIDGPTGGYNLTAAFATAGCAAEAVAARKRRRGGEAR